ncbi:carbamoyltransferase C-terminal domain-containing protein [Streptomyces sp. R44]|uniref:Carbamoyltransferase C-terminal domain-containing protein n=1 Tax=Streptomyces sp. R44 TaxID=3238633 RepID=A0AB39T9W1_9ACTN
MLAPGHYLSTYLAPVGQAALPQHLHDHCAALWVKTEHDIKLVRYWELERVSGVKHHNLPLYTTEATQDLLRQLVEGEGVSYDDLLGVWGTPGVGRTDALQAFADEHDLPLHSLAHLFTALVGEPAAGGRTVLGFAVDGGPDMATETRSKHHWYAGGTLAADGSLRLFPVESPGALYSAAKALYGLEQGSLMALASASESRIEADPDDVLGTSTFWGPEARRNADRVLADLDALARDRAASGEGWHDDPRFDAVDNRISAVMKVVQHASESVMLRNVERAVKEHALDPADTVLALAGGYALNCPTNTLLMNRFGFAALSAPPCVNDSGQALGLGLLGFHLEDPPSRGSFSLGTAFHGNDRLRLPEALRRWSDHIVDTSDFDEERFLADLADGPVAWVHGPAEIGPRALGARSLLGDPRTLATRDRLNEIKRRQWWRPVAPIVLSGHVQDWFEEGRDSPYMLEAFHVRHDRREHIPAALHLDGSARVQTLRPQDNPALHTAVSAFHRATGIPVLCNTSLNDKGEPIVDDAVHALNFCLRRGVDIAYIDGTRVRLAPRPEALPEGRERRHEQLFLDHDDERARLWETWTAAGHEPAAVFLLARSPELRAVAEQPNGPAVLRRMLALAARRSPHFDRIVTDFLKRCGPGASRAGLTDSAVDFDALDEL